MKNFHERKNRRKKLQLDKEQHKPQCNGERGPARKEQGFGRKQCVCVWGGVSTNIIMEPIIFYANILLKKTCENLFSIIVCLQNKR